MTEHATAPTHDGPPPCEMDVLEMQLCRAKARIAELREACEKQQERILHEAARVAELEAGLAELVDRCEFGAKVRGGVGHLADALSKTRALLEASNG